MTVNLNKLFYFIGIKGSGMASLALILHDNGYRVAGSDIKQYTFTQLALEKANIPIYEFNKSNNLEPNSIVILGNAFKDDHPEVIKAKEMGLPVIRYHKFLGEFMKDKISIGIAGAHGKTSTTGLLSHVFSGIIPTSYLIGDGTGKGIKDSKYFIFEADEYRRHFLAYYPDYAICTNIDFDHPDYYQNMEDVYDAFESFAKQVKKAVFAYGDDENLRRLNIDVPVYYYGIGENNDIEARNIQRTIKGSSFDVYIHNKFVGNFKINLYGKHNVLNSLAVIAVAYFEKIPMDELKRELLSFKGVKRRFAEYQIGDITIIDDYAHHPSEIRATIDAARQKYPDKEIIAVFQPHTFTRTIAYLDDYVNSLSLADHVYLTDIFASARESNGNISSEDLGNKINKGGEVLKVDNMSPLLNYDNAVIIFMGAGDIQKYEQTYEQLLNDVRIKNV